jgi:hydrogenase-4 component B
VQILVALIGWALRPNVRQPQIRGHFPQHADFASEVPDTILDRGLIPASQRGARMLSWFRVLQQGSMEAYLLYIFAVVIILLVWAGRGHWL